MNNKIQAFISVFVSVLLIFMFTASIYATSSQDLATTIPKDHEIYDDLTYLYQQGYVSEDAYNITQNHQLTNYEIGLVLSNAYYNFLQDEPDVNKEAALLGEIAKEFGETLVVLGFPKDTVDSLKVMADQYKQQQQAQAQKEDQSSDKKEQSKYITREEFEDLKEDMVAEAKKSNVEIHGGTEILTRQVEVSGNVPTDDDGVPLYKNEDTLKQTFDLNITGHVTDDVQVTANLAAENPNGLLSDMEGGTPLLLKEASIVGLQNEVNKLVIGVQPPTSFGDFTYKAEGENGLSWQHDGDLFNFMIMGTKSDLFPADSDGNQAPRPFTRYTVGSRVATDQLLKDVNLGLNFVTTWDSDKAEGWQEDDTKQRLMIGSANAKGEFKGFSIDSELAILNMDDDTETSNSPKETTVPAFYADLSKSFLENTLQTDLSVAYVHPDFDADSLVEKDETESDEDEENEENEEDDMLEDIAANNEETSNFSYRYPAGERGIDFGISWRKNDFNISAQSSYWDGSNDDPDANLKQEKGGSLAASWSKDNFNIKGEFGAWLDDGDDNTVLEGSLGGSYTLEFNADSSKNGQYVVEAGDYLSSIADKFNTSVDAIKETNNLKSDNIFIGQELAIPGQQKTERTLASITLDEEIGFEKENEDPTTLSNKVSLKANTEFIEGLNIDSQFSHDFNTHESDPVNFVNAGANASYDINIGERVVITPSYEFAFKNGLEDDPSTEEYDPYVVETMNHEGGLALTVEAIKDTLAFKGKGTFGAFNVKQSQLDEDGRYIDGDPRVGGRFTAGATFTPQGPKWLEGLSIDGEVGKEIYDYTEKAADKNQNSIVAGGKIAYQNDIPEFFKVDGQGRVFYNIDTTIDNVEEYNKLNQAYGAELTFKVNEDTNVTARHSTEKETDKNAKEPVDKSTSTTGITVTTQPIGPDGPSIDFTLNDISIKDKYNPSESYSIKEIQSTVGGRF
ncbi:MAG: LysM peptidoglycan-binding domain-containing protein [bacterium]